MKTLKNIIIALIIAMWAVIFAVEMSDIDWQIISYQTILLSGSLVFFPTFLIFQSHESAPAK